MGLDMYLRAKTDTRKYEGATGACSGLFGLAPEDDGMVEIGYWRKAYDQQELFSRVITTYNPSDDNCVNMRVTLDEINFILKKAREAVKTGDFDKDGMDSNSNFSTFDSKRKWKDTIKFFRAAKQILKTDPTAEIYYCQWY